MGNITIKKNEDLEAHIIQNGDNYFIVSIINEYPILPLLYFNDIKTAISFTEEYLDRLEKGDSVEDLDLLNTLEDTLNY